MPQILLTIENRGLAALEFPPGVLISPDSVSAVLGLPGNLKFSGFKFGLATFEFPGPLLGGKGGFGSLLRSQKHWAKRTTNFDSSRDLSGRRLREAQAGERLRTWVEEQRREDAVVAELREDQAPPEKQTLPDEFVAELKIAGRDKRKLIATALDDSTEPEKPAKSFKRTKLDLEISSDED